MQPDLVAIGNLTEAAISTLSDNDALHLLGYTVGDPSIGNDGMGSTHRRRGAVRGLWLAMRQDPQAVLPDGEITLAESDRQIAEIGKTLARETVRAGRDSGIEARQIIEALETAGLELPGTTGQRVTLAIKAMFDMPPRNSDGVIDDAESMYRHLFEHRGNAHLIVSGRDLENVALVLDNCWGPDAVTVPCAGFEVAVEGVVQTQVLEPEFASYLRRGMNGEDDYED